MLVDGFTLATAMTMIKTSREVSYPNFGFMNQLVELEHAIFGRNTVLKEALSLHASEI
jgi:hypothetical protein